ncbi:uncharacterized protein LOC131944690 isoform X1 [Physella acuta]|uniref:uncharacterized protein LOC131944690 isoform X1 n=1 Tax=Physella acuta TaxID=109671 RepID=UPI0027DC4326|nr:uncharacterized protein LOC131944690 isoform X1 [Physella acuta]
MASNALFGLAVLLICGSRSTVVNQTTKDTLVSPSVIEEGGTFTVTCDASRAGVPTSVISIVSLTIASSNGGTEPKTLARNRLYPPPYQSQLPPITSPARNWSFQFTGSLSATSDRPINRNTIKIEIVVNDAKCSDAGLYFCNATYLNENDDETPASNYQNVTSRARAVPLSLMLVPQYEEGLGPYQSVNPAGSNVTLTCNVNGPKALIFTWKYGPSIYDVNSFTSYPVQNAVSVAEPVLVSSGTTCVQYIHSSTLKFQTEDMYDGYMYVCVATENNRDTKIGNMTIYTKIGNHSYLF